MAETAETKDQHKDQQKQSTSDKPKIHRVCIQCNNMFEVTADHFEEKHCPSCHKG